MCRASTQEWAIKKFLYNYTDAAALQIVAKVLGQRALQVRGVCMKIYYRLIKLKNITVMI